MSVFKKSSFTFIALAAVLYLFSSATFFPFFQENKSIDHDKLVTYALKEVTYEMTYGEENVDLDMFVDNAVKEALRTN